MLLFSLRNEIRYHTESDHLKAGCGYVVPMREMTYCVVTIGDDDPCRRHEIPGS
jgi:hypothetical protein